MKRIVIMSISLLMIAIIMAAGVYADQYAWKTDIQISNTSGNEYSGRILFDVPASALIDGGYMRADASDVYLSGAYITAMDLSAGTATWSAGYYNIPAGVSKYTLQIGSPSMTRNQLWIGADGDNCYAEHDASLSFNSGSSFAINCDVTLVGTPVGECFDDTPEFIFRAYEVGTSTTSQNLVPNQYISNTADISGGSLPDLLTDSSDSSYIHDYTDTSITIVGLSNPTLPESLNVGTVTVYVRGKEGVGGGASTVEPALGYTSYQSGSEMALTTSWAWHTEIFPADPDGNAWDVDDMHNLRLKLTINGIPTVLVSEAYVMVEGTYSGSPTSVSTPATIGTDTNLTGYYINGLIGVSDSSATATGTVSTLNTNTASIHVGEFNGYIDNVKVSTP